MLRGRAKHHAARAGQSLVEFSMVLPLLIVLTVAVGDFGRVYASGVAVEDAAREAADFAAFDDLTASQKTPATAASRRATRVSGRSR